MIYVDKLYCLFLLLSTNNYMDNDTIPSVSSDHDAWLSKYSKMVATLKYYELCNDLVEEIFKGE